MTQPPYGDAPGPWNGPGQPPPYGVGPSQGYPGSPAAGYGQSQQPPQYPRQNLLPQAPQPRRSRLPLALVAAGLVVVLVGVFVTLRVIHDRGERNRAAYCSALKTVTRSGNLVQVIAGAGQDSSSLLTKVRELAPSSVKSQWNDLFTLVTSGGTGQPSLSEVAKIVTDLQGIVDDANENCGMKIQIPF